MQHDIRLPTGAVVCKFPVGICRLKRTCKCHMEFVVATFCCLGQVVVGVISRMWKMADTKDARWLPILTHATQKHNSFLSFYCDLKSCRAKQRTREVPPAPFVLAKSGKKVLKFSALCQVVIDCCVVRASRHSQSDDMFACLLVCLFVV